MIFTTAICSSLLLLAPLIIVYAAPAVIVPKTIPSLAALENIASYISTTSAPADPATTYNELAEGKCAPFILLFARGTNGSGNVGEGVAPALIRELTSLRPGQFIVQGTNNYPATIPDYLLGGSATGAASMADDVAMAAHNCKDSKIVMAGYSQGAQVVHRAAAQISKSLYPFVRAIVLFGDPNRCDPFPGSLNDNVLGFCHDGDYICQPGLPIPEPKHFTYEDDTPAAAVYISARV